ncbi:DnaD domain-containing protein [Sporolactobacillus sp. Y61]|jgi:DNA replication protein|uniref:DnaD domain-containing protein n=1 Tax=Sporolactobacillus sp. Y61 TaxID=3160863 RepID=A0AAU8IDZ3_9BACL|nr:DnaD domain-containing protein [Sporolactobacillus sp. THM19-2]RYL93315.1 DnaD domain protein [Sporolactobacillus sp. THM19-2]
MDTKFMLHLMTDSSVSIPSLLIKHYHDIGLNEQECMLLIQVHSFIIKGDDFPTFTDLSRRMTLDETACADMLRTLVQRGFLSIVQKTENDVYSEAYSLTPLWEKLLQYAVRQESKAALQGNEEALYTLFENEFSRPLSPIECETLAMWIDEDHQSPAMIKAALREAVVSGKLNFRYIDRILFEWKKNGIKTLDQAKEHGDQIRHLQQSHHANKGSVRGKAPQKPAYDWLDHE